LPSEAAPAAAEATPRIAGRHLILGLFVALAAATAAVLLGFAPLAPEDFRARIYFALAGNLALPVVGWFLMKGFQSPGPWRATWFLMAPAGGLAAIAAVLALVAWTGLLPWGGP
jgi:hypothetical protein